MECDVRTKTVNVYVAASYSAKQRAKTLATALKANGYNVVSQWMFREVETDLNEVRRLDLEELRCANVLVMDTSIASTAGGMFYEMGYARSLGMPVILLGDRKSAFDHDPNVYAIDWGEVNFDFKLIGQLDTLFPDAKRPLDQSWTLSASGKTLRKWNFCRCHHCALGFTGAQVLRDNELTAQGHPPNMKCWKNAHSGPYLPKEERVVSSTGGAKGMKDARFDLLPPDWLWELATHFGKGDKKYPPDTPFGKQNWKKGYDWSLSIGAHGRHVSQWRNGEMRDSETGSHHLIAAAWHLLVLWWFETHKVGTDPRSPK